MSHEKDTEPLPRRLLKAGLLSGEESYRERVELSLSDDPEEIVRKLPLKIEGELDPPSDITGFSLFPQDMKDDPPTDIERVLSEFLQERRRLIRVLDYRKLSKACSMK